MFSIARRLIAAVLVVCLMPLLGLSELLAHGPELRTPLSDQFITQALASPAVYGGKATNETSLIDKKLTVELRKSDDPASPEVLLTQIPDLYAQGQYEQVLQAYRILANHHLNRYGSKVVPLLPLLLISMDELGAKPIMKGDELGRMYGWFNGMSDRDIAALVKPNESPASAHNALVRLGVGILYTVKMIGQERRKVYTAMLESAKKAAVYYPEASDFSGITDAKKYIEQVGLNKGDMYYFVSNAYTVLWEQSQDLHDLEELTQSYHLTATAYLLANERVEERLGVMYMLEAIYGLQLSEYRHDTVEASLKKAGELLDRAKQVRGHSPMIAVLEGFIALREGKLREAEDKFMIGMSDYDDDLTRGGLVSISLRRGNPQEAVKWSSGLGKLTPRDIYERGRAHYELAMIQSAGSQERQKEYERAWKSWSELNESTRKIVDYLGETRRYDEDFLRVSLSLGKTDIVLVRFVTGILSRGNTVSSRVFEVLHDVLPFQQETGFLKSLHQSVPGPLKSLVADRLRQLEGVKIEKAPIAEPAATETEILLSEWARLKVDQRTNKTHIDKLFEKNLWTKQSAAWKLEQTRDWLRDWWSWPPKNQTKGTPPMAQRGEILQRVVKELEKTILEIDEQNVAEDQSLINETSLNDILHMLEPWVKKRPGEDHRMDPLRLRTPQTSGAIAKSMQELAALKERRAWKARYAVLASEAKSLLARPAADFIGANASKDLRARGVETRKHISELIGQTPLHLRLILQPVMDSVLIPLEALLEAIELDDRRGGAVSEVESLGERLAAIGQRIVSRIAADKTNLDEVTRSLNTLGKKARTELAKTFPVTVTLRMSRAALALARKGEPIAESDVTLTFQQSFVTLLWDRGLTTGMVDVYENGNPIRDYDGRPSNGAILEMVPYGLPRLTEWPEPPELGPPLEVNMILESPYAQEFAAAMAAQGLAEWGTWAADYPKEPVNFSLEFKQNALIVSSVRDALRILETDHEAFEIFRDGHAVKPNERFQGGEHITVRRHSSNAGMRQIGLAIATLVWWSVLLHHVLAPVSGGAVLTLSSMIPSLNIILISAFFIFGMANLKSIALNAKQQIQVRILENRTGFRFSDPDRAKLIAYLSGNKFIGPADLGLKLRGLDDLLKTVGVTDDDARHMFIVQNHEKFGSLETIDDRQRASETLAKMGVGILASPPSEQPKKSNKLKTPKMLVKKEAFLELAGKRAYIPQAPKPAVPITPPKPEPFKDLLAEARKKQDDRMAAAAAPILIEARKQIPYVPVGIKTLMSSHPNMFVGNLDRMDAFQKVLARNKRNTGEAAILNAAHDLTQSGQAPSITHLLKASGLTRTELDNVMLASGEVNQAVKVYLSGWRPPATTKTMDIAQQRSTGPVTKQNPNEVYTLKDAQGRLWAKGRWVYKKPEGWGFIVSLQDYSVQNDERRIVGQPDTRMTVRFIGDTISAPEALPQIGDSSEPSADMTRPDDIFPYARFSELFRSPDDLAKSNAARQQDQKHAAEISALLRDLAPLSREIADNAASVYQSLFSSYAAIESVRAWLKDRRHPLPAAILFEILDTAASGRGILVPLLEKGVAGAMDEILGRGPMPLTHQELDWFNDLAHKSLEGFQYGKVDWAGHLLKALGKVGKFKGREHIIANLITESKFDRPQVGKAVEAMRRHFAASTAQSA